MIVKVHSFTDGNVQGSKNFVHGRNLATKLADFAQDISLAPDRPIQFVEREFNEILASVRNVPLEGVFWNFNTASKMAYRVEKSIKTISEDVRKYISIPLQVHISFFKKQERQTFYEIIARFPDDWSGRVYEVSCIGHGKIPHLIGS